MVENYSISSHYIMFSNIYVRPALAEYSTAVKIISYRGNNRKRSSGLEQTNLQLNAN